MPYAVVYKNAMLDAVPPDSLSLHLSSPGATGTGELSTATGSPFYARKTPTWSSASAGAKALSNSPVFDVYSGASVVAIGFWRSSVYQGYVTVTTETYASQGTYTITSGSIDLMSTANA